VPRGGTRSERPWPPPLPLVVVLAVAAALRLLPLTRSHYLTGVLEYDDGVHYAAALASLHGQWPYADYAFLHPPGIVVLMAPFAALGQVLSQPVAMAAARVAVLVVGLFSVVLVWRLARGPQIARAAAAGAYAVAPAVLIAEHTVLLEPLVNLGGLLALGILLGPGGPASRPGSRAVRAAGIVLGATVAIKVFAAAYPLAIALWLVAQRRFRLALLHLAAAAGTFLVLLAPFLLRDPAATVRDVALLQLHRPAAGVPPGAARGSDLLALTAALGHRAGDLVVLAAVVAVLLAVLHLGRQPRAGLLVLLLVTGVGGFLLAPSYYSHYAAFLLPPAALLTGEVAAYAARSPTRGPRTLGMGSAGVVLAVLAAGAVRTTIATSGQGDVRAAVSRLSHPPACLFTDSASLAVAANRLRPASRACPSWVDGRAQALTLVRPGEIRDLYDGGIRRLEPWQRQIRVQLMAADAVLVRGSATTVPEWSPPTRQYVASHFLLVATSSDGPAWQLWERRGHEPP